MKEKKTKKTRSEFAAVVILANPGLPGLENQVQSKYGRITRGHCVIIKDVISTLLPWMSLHVTSQQTTPSEVDARDFAWPPVVTTFLSNFQSCMVCSVT